jgi:peptide/nickel transport system substrate-binding protein
MRRLYGLIACLVVLSLVLSGCGGGATKHNTAKGASGYAMNGTFTMSYWSDPGIFNPYRNQLILNYYLAYDSLVNLLPDGRFVSGLAERWTADARSAKFTLRPDITCSDGTPLTAGQVAAAINYVSDPRNGSPRRGFLVPSMPLKATADDTKRTVDVVMTKDPFGFLLNTVGRLPIVCKEGMDNPDIFKTRSAGTGPFVLTKVVPGDSYTFHVRKGYKWGPAGASTSAPGTPATVVLKTITNESTAANLLLSGQLNYAMISGEDQNRLDAQKVNKLKSTVPGAWLWFNQLGGRATADKSVRQALVQALDRAQVIKVSTGGAGSASKGLVTMEPKPCTGDTVAGHLPEHDNAAAASLLDGAGWTKGADGVRRKNGRALKLEIHFVNLGFDKQTAELLAANWNAIGVQTKLTTDTAPGAMGVMFQTGNWDIYLTGFGYTLPSQAVPYNSGKTPPGGTNLSGMHNKEYEMLATKAATMVAPEACDYWAKAEQALYRNVDIAPISEKITPYYLKNAEAQLVANAVIPTSIRLLK